MFYDLSDPAVRTRNLQTMLRYLSFALDDVLLRANVTGSFDKRTRDAVRRFQEINRLPATGNADLVTWEEIARQYRRESSLRAPVLLNPIGPGYDFKTVPTERSDTVLILQVLLDALREKYDYNYIPLSGIYGSDTTGAVKIFQQKNQLSSTGIADRTTWQKLVREYNSLGGI